MRSSPICFTPLPFNPFRPTSSKGWLERGLDAAHMGVCEWDVRADRLVLSDLVEPLCGRPMGSTSRTGAGYLDLVHAADRDQVAADIARALASDIVDLRLEHRVIWPDGAVRWIACKGRVLRDAEGAPRQLVWTVVDVTKPITERKRIEAELRASELERQRLEERCHHVQKLEAIGQVAGGIAHDFNNIVAVIMASSRLIAKIEGLAPRARELNADIQDASERAARLTRQLLQFRRGQATQTSRIDLNQMVRGMTRMLERSVNGEVSLQFELHPAPLHVDADVGLLEQVLLNLAINARDAMPHGGRLVIETALEVVDDAGAVGGPAPGRYACLRVRDSGCGIAAEHMTRIFEPFFTTKEPGKGTGLGLASVLAIVQQHHGLLTATSEPGCGTTFTVRLPEEPPSMPTAGS